MARAKKVPASISEEYYQISLAILTSFFKYRPPVDLFTLRPTTEQLILYSKKGDRISNEQVEEIHKLCEQGDLFVSRSDHHIYSHHIVKQPDLVLVDANLKEAEIADILQRALASRLQDFFAQPVMLLYDALYTDAMVFIEYIAADPHRIRLFARRLHREHTLVNHTLNCLGLGTWLFLQTTPEYTKKDIEKLVLGLLLHDLGMDKVPNFIMSKTTMLKPEEKDKIPPHTLIGVKTIQKLDMMIDEIRQAVVEHHERLDGSGYPQKLKDKQISKTGRLVAVVDSFSAMITKRAYAPAKELIDAATELANSKTLYDQPFAVFLRNALLTNVLSNFIDPTIAVLPARNQEGDEGDEGDEGNDANDANETPEDGEK